MTTTSTAANVYGTRGHEAPDAPGPFSKSLRIRGRISRRDGTRSFTGTSWQPGLTARACSRQQASSWVRSTLPELRRYQAHFQAPRTSPFHAGNTTTLQASSRTGAALDVPHSATGTLRRSANRGLLTVGSLPTIRRHFGVFRRRRICQTIWPASLVATRNAGSNMPAGWDMQQGTRRHTRARWARLSHDCGKHQTIIHRAQQQKHGSLEHSLTGYGGGADQCRLSI